MNHQEVVATGRLATSDGAVLHWERSGRRGALAALWLHGGPGGSLGEGAFRQYFDPSRYDLVALDQRGSGRSRPLVAERPEALVGITTQRMVADLEELREHLGIVSWVVAGASWGTTLALAYALEHPERVLALGLLAVTTTGRDEVDWITDGLRRFVPEEWSRFEQASGRREGERVVDAYARRLAEGTPADREQAAAAWDEWEAVLVRLDVPEAAPARHEDPLTRLGFATMVTHLWSHDAFLPGDRAILERAHELDGIPAALVHGRRDISGPAITPHRLHEQWPTSTLTVVEGEGHGGPGQAAALTEALDRFAAPRSPGDGDHARDRGTPT